MNFWNRELGQVVDRKTNYHQDKVNRKDRKENQKKRDKSYVLTLHTFDQKHCRLNPGIIYFSDFFFFLFFLESKA